jgi:hypothetical protein
MNIDWNSIPTFEIDCNTLVTPANIMNIFRERKVEWYLYRIKYKGIVIKFGMSAATSEHRDYGERLYRQIAHLSTWGDKQIRGASGSEFRIVEDDFTARYGKKLKKKHITLKVYDFTNYAFDTIKPVNEIYYAEQELIRTYQTLVDEKPIGNIDDDKNVFQKKHISKQVWQHFEEE